MCQYVDRASPGERADVESNKRTHAIANVVNTMRETNKSGRDISHRVHTSRRKSVLWQDFGTERGTNLVTTGFRSPFCHPRQ